MSLGPDTTLGPYEVTAQIGQGGMGEVYRARDTKLDRDVALKVLPHAFTDDPDRLARFEREAKVLASLNHPNIGHIYGLEEAEGQKALVLELVEGPTLADRITQGPIPVDEALPIAKQIAEALEAAHEQGVIHRDLKPANVKVKADGTVKVLDFGLAKALQPDPEGDPSQSPTLTATATRAGIIMGTAAYMAPEQAKGRVADKRADVWAFGAVLYEMLTGQKPFVGDDVSEVMAGVIKSEPGWDALPTELPAALATYLRRCLEKDPRERIRDIGDVRLAMAGAFDLPAPPSVELLQAPVTVPRPQIWQRPIFMALLLLVSTTIVGLAVWAVTRPEPGDLIRFTIVPPDTTPLRIGPNRHDLVISPDGTQVVWAIEAGLYLLPMDQLDGTPLRGGEGGLAPFFSPDGEWVGFVEGASTLQKVSIFGGPPVTLTVSPSAVAGASWGTDDRIIFGASTAGLLRVSAGGGEAEVLTTPDTEQGAASHTYPFIIPDREAVIFVISTGQPLTTGELAVLDLDTGEVTRLGLAGVSPRYISTGHLVYAAEDGSVRAVPFDASSFEVTGNPVPLLEGVIVKARGAANFSISDNGRLVYVSGAGEGGQRSLVWVDRQGLEEPIAVPPRNYVYPRVSPDGTRVALDLRDEESDVWIWDLARESLQRLTFDAAQDNYALWTPDGQRVVFQSQRDGGISHLYWKAADGTGEAERLGEIDGPLAPNAVSPDGTLLVFRQGQPPGYDLSILHLDGDRSTESLLDVEFDETNGEISPDGRWLAYQSNASGQSEVYVRPFPSVNEGQWLISTGGGTKPLWGPDGGELFFRSGSGVVAVPIQTEPTFTAGTPQPLFDGPYRFTAPGRGYDITPDGERFLMVKIGSVNEDAAPSQITVVLNWLEELKGRVPVD